MTDCIGKKTQYWIDNAKVIGILVIILFHVCEITFINKFASSFQNELFFFIGGVVFSQKSLKTFFRRKMQTIIIPYFVYGFLSLTFFLLIESRFRDIPLTFSQGVYGLITGTMNYVAFNSPLWFIPCFFMALLIMNCIGNSSTKKMVGFLAAFFLTSLFMPVIPGQYDFFSWTALPRYMVFVILGSLLRKICIFEKINTLSKIIQIVFAGVCIGITALIVVLNIKFCASSYLGSIFGISGIVFISHAIGEHTAFSTLSKYNIHIICLHGPVYRAVIFISERLLNLTGVRKNIFWSLAISIVTYFAVCLFSCFVAKIKDACLHHTPFRKSIHNDSEKNENQADELEIVE